MPNDPLPPSRVHPLTGASAGAPAPVLAPPPPTSEPPRGVLEATPAAAPANERAPSPADRTCEVCGNQYDKTIRVVSNGRSHVFDCFECAIHALAPVCAHCGCRIVGHGMESDGAMFCCAHCAHSQGVGTVKDRADGATS